MTESPATTAEPAPGTAPPAAGHDPDLDDGHGHDEVHLRREALTMGLYVCITLLAALTVTGATPAGEGAAEVLTIIWGTTVGLALAHWLAFGLAAQLVEAAPPAGVVARQLSAQLGAAAVVAGVATVEVLVLPDDVARSGARFTTACLIGAVTLAQRRSFGSSWRRALVTAAAAVVLALLVAGVKHALAH